MHIVMISPECSPIAKVGGLADVVISLSKALQEQGNKVEIILPKYDCMRYDKIHHLRTVQQQLMVSYEGGVFPNEVMLGEVEGVSCYFIDTNWFKQFFNRQQFYGEHDDSERFAYFSKAALEFLYQRQQAPDIIHYHDWPTGLVPIYFHSIYRHLGLSQTRLVFTIHNFAYQGVAPDSVIDKMALMSQDIPYAGWEEGSWGTVNFLKLGIIGADYVTTVSPTYSQEVLYSDKGMGLQQLLHTHSYKFSGILNGLDYEYWNPATDSVLPVHYDDEQVEGKYGNKKVLRDRLWLRESYKPIVAIITRLVQQKGTELIKRAVSYSLEKQAQVVLLGSSPDPQIQRDFESIQQRLREHPDCHLELAYDEELSHLIYAGADIMVIPSIFEPCGLTQLIALRYGTVPVVRFTGGLADTVFDAEYSMKDWSNRNGFVFESADFGGVEFGLRRAIEWWFERPEDFRQLMLHGMRQDFSWRRSCQEYLKIYRGLLGEEVAEI